MQTSNEKAAFWEGVRSGAPFVVVIVPFAVLFGVVGTEAGLNIYEVMGFSVLVIAGAAQFTAVQLMTENTPTLIVLISALAVNLRMAMYSASLAPYLGTLTFRNRALVAYFMVDQTYAVSVDKFETDPKMTTSERLAFFLGVMIPVCPLWYVGTFAGAALGTQIPKEFALDFAVPITFLALIAPALRTPAHVAAAATAVVFSLLLAGLPYSLGVLIAAFLAILVGAQTEVALERRKR